jgi:long-chain fatty acid transport protein
MRAQFAVVAASLLATSHAMASGFHIDEQDGRATGRAGAVKANPDSPSAIYYNPAGVAELKGFQVAVGTTLVSPRGKFTSETTGRTTAAKASNFFLPNAYLTYRVSEFLGVGLGLNAPFGLSIEWPESSPGRSVVRKQELQTVFIMPAVALNFSHWIPGLSFAAGVDLVPANVHLAKDIPFGVDFATVELGAKAFGVGARAGLLYRPEGLRGLSFGLTYRSPVKLDFKGTADFDASPVYRSQLPPDGDGGTSLTLPQTIAFGVAVDPVPGWQLELDVDYKGWSSYDSLTINLPGGQSSYAEKNWENALALRVGTDIAFAEGWSARAGFIWDQTPVPPTTLDFVLPDADRLVTSVGLGWAMSPAVRADLAALYVLPSTQTTAMDDPYRPPVKGTYQVTAMVIAASLGFKLPGQ